MKKYFTLLLLFLTLGLSAQESDSTYIRQFLRSTEFPAVEAVYYEKKYRGKRLLEEGWIVEECLGADARIMRDSAITDCGLFGTYRIGIWKYYRSDNSFDRVDTNYFEDEHMISFEYDYWKNGRLRYYSYSRVDYNHPDRKKQNSGWIKDEEHYGDFTFIIYDRRGRSKKKWVWIDNELVEGPEKS